MSDINRVLGYVRVSTKDQNTDRQEEAIRNYCRDNNINLRSTDIITDKVSGKDFNRQGYQVLKKQLLREGDTLIIKELDRLGRDMEMIKEEWNDLVKLGINIVVIDTPILNTGNKTDLEKSLISNIIFELLSYMAEKERLKIKQRQAEGIKAAKEQGKTLGRPNAELPEEFIEIYSNWDQGKITAKNAMDQLGLKRTTFYKLVKIYQILIDILNEIQLVQPSDFELNKVYSNWDKLDKSTKLAVGRAFKKWVSSGKVPKVTSLGTIKGDNHQWYRKA